MISNFSQFSSSYKTYALTPKATGPNGDVDAAIQGPVVWTSNRPDLVSIVADQDGLNAVISLAPYNMLGAVEAYATAVNVNGVSFTHTLAISMPVPPPPPPAADHFEIVQG